MRVQKYYFFLIYKVFSNFVALLYENMAAFNIKSFITTVLLGVTWTLSAQTGNVKSDKLLIEAKHLHSIYEFDEAAAIYEKVLENTTDSSARLEILNKIIECQNGKNLLQYIVRPTTVAAANFPTGTFFLHIGELPQGAWKPIPNPFVNPTAGHGHRFCTATYFPDNSSRIIYSAPDENGAWNIYTSSLKDTLWSLPQLLSKNILSEKDEIYPMLSADGKTLYFASDGMAGMGGYDLFYSRWNERTKDWDTPENMGFPYSSTADDIFYFNTPDGQFSIVASNRNTTADSIKIYVTEALATPVRTPLEKGESVLQIASLNIRTDLPQRGSGTEASGADEEQQESDNPIENYSKSIKELRGLQAEYRSKYKKIAESRSIYNRASGEDREFMAEIIRETEAEALVLKKQIDAASAEIRKAEAEFLSKGIIPKISEQEDHDPESEQKTENTPKQEYQFRTMDSGIIPYNICIEQPKPKFDYTFRILKNKPGQFAEDTKLPVGLVYQIQFMVTSSPAKVKDIRNMTPVFVTKQPSGKYLHTVGIFKTYAEAAAALGKVKKNGFPQAFIIAYNNGKSLSVKQARILESNIN